MSEPSGEHKGRLPNGQFAPGVIPEGAKPFPPGVSGNPTGRPKGIPNLKAALMRRLAKAGLDEEGVGPDVDEIAAFLIAQAKEDPAAMKHLWDRVEGSVAKEHKHSGSVGIKVLDLRDGESP